MMKRASENLRTKRAEGPNCPIQQPAYETAIRHPVSQSQVPVMASTLIWVITAPRSPYVAYQLTLSKTTQASASVVAGTRLQMRLIASCEHATCKMSWLRQSRFETS